MTYYTFQSTPHTLTNEDLIKFGKTLGLIGLTIIALAIALGFEVVDQLNNLVESSMTEPEAIEPEPTPAIEPSQEIIEYIVNVGTKQALGTRELRKIAQAIKVEGYRTMNKSQLIEAIA